MCFLRENVAMAPDVSVAGQNYGQRENGVVRVKRKRVFSFLCAVWMLLALMPMPTVARASTEKVIQERAIAVVFDNSGSMYMGDANQSKAWCRATYGIEVFASMMNKGDILEIYPMSPVEVDGKSYSQDSPLVIDNESKVSKIRDIYTPKAGATPIETVTAAYEGLSKHNGKEQWLIVLTDGAIFYENGHVIGGDNQNSSAMVSSTQKALSEKLTQYNNQVNVLYLGIGEGAIEIGVDGSKQHGSEVSHDTADVLDNLTSMCNQIFGRDALPNAGKSISLDLSMNKMIVFVQGKNVSGISLKNKNGDSGRVSNSYSVRYGEKGAGNYQPSVIDKDLQGMIVTYEDCPAGDYELEFKGSASNISIYYEPNVDLAAILVDEEGKPVSNTCTAGTYYIQYGLVDEKGEFTTSSLLGKTNYKITHTINGEDHATESDEAGKVKVELKAGDTLDVQAEARYLSGYYIQRSGSDLGWPSGGYQIAARPAGDLKLQVTGGEDSYKLSQLEESTGYGLKLTYEDIPLSGEALEAVEINVDVENGNVGHVVEQTAEGLGLQLKYNQVPQETKCGEQTMHVTAVYTNEDGLQVVSEAVDVPFTLEDDRLALEVELGIPQKYYQLSKIDRGEPMKAYVTNRGIPLTDEQLESVTVECQAEGLTLNCTPLPGESAYTIELVDEEGYKSGKYAISVKAVGEDYFGQTTQAEDNGRIELGVLPWWVRWVIAILILLLILLAIWAFLNQKILPRQISVRSGSTIFNVDGSRVAGVAKVEFTGKNRRNGSLTVSTPKCSADPLAKGGFNLELIAVTPRKTKSAARRAGVLRVNPINGSAVHTIQVGTSTYKKDAQGKFVKVGAKPKTAKKGEKEKNTVVFEVGNNANCVISGETVAGTSFSCTCKLQFH